MVLSRLEARDLSLTTLDDSARFLHHEAEMAAEMFPVTWEKEAACIPSCRSSRPRGYQELFTQLESWLAEITGFAAVPCSPMRVRRANTPVCSAIRAWHLHHGDAHRDVCLIPTSAHGTNPASAVMAGMKVVAVLCDANGNIDQ